jgi:hypothetical protein
MRSKSARNVRFTPKASELWHRSEKARCAMTGCEQMQQASPYSSALKASPAVMIDYVEATRSRRIGGMLTVSV